MERKIKEPGMIIKCLSSVVTGLHWPFSINMRTEKAKGDKEQIIDYRQVTKAECIDLSTSSISVVS